MGALNEVDGALLVTPVPAKTPSRTWPERLRAAHRRVPISVAVSILFLVAFVVVGIFGKWMAPQNVGTMNLIKTLAPPGTKGFPLGTDEYGRDILSRLIVGTQSSLFFTGLTIVIAAAFGMLVGTISGMAAGLPGLRRWTRWVDPVLMGFTNLTLSIPVILIALLLAVVVGYNFWVLILILVLFAWPPYAKVARERAISTCVSPLIELALVAGTGFFAIGRRHVLPRVADGGFVIMTLQVGYVLTAAATLSFLGVGPPPPAPTWGGMVSDGLQVLGQAWWVATIPAIAIALVVLAGNTVGDWLREVLDPTVRI